MDVAFAVALGVVALLVVAARRRRRRWVRVLDLEVDFAAMWFRRAHDPVPAEGQLRRGVGGWEMRNAMRSEWLPVSAEMGAALDAAVPRPARARVVALD